MMKIAKPTSVHLSNKKGIPPSISFYTLQAELNTGKVLAFETLKGKNVLIVNTASNCGYTAQYEGLQALHQKHQHDLVVLGFPANDFKNQEAGSDAEIAEFCKINYGVSFPIMKKTHVVKHTNQHPVFDWLSNEEKNGWCTQQPTWNFCKYLINKDGQLVHFYDAKVDPADIKL
jgi:glutathione peroxidase